MAIDPTPARVSASAPRPSVSSAARAATSSDDHRSKATPAFPSMPRANASRRRGRERKVRRRKRFVHPRGALAHEPERGADDVDAPCRSRLEGLCLDVTALRRSECRAFSGTSVNTCVPPEGQLTVSFKMRSLAPRPMSSSFECCDRNPEPACTTSDLAESIGLDGHAGADRVAVAGGATQAHGERRRSSSAKSFRKIRSCGACRSAITTRSGSPSPSMSRTANDRPS